MCKLFMSYIYTISYELKNTLDHAFKKNSESNPYLKVASLLLHGLITKQKLNTYSPPQIPQLSLFQSWMIALSMVYKEHTLPQEQVKWEFSAVGYLTCSYQAAYQTQFIPNKKQQNNLAPLFGNNNVQSEKVFIIFQRALNAVLLLWTQERSPWAVSTWISLINIDIADILQVSISTFLRLQ